MKRKKEAPAGKQGAKNVMRGKPYHKHTEFLCKNQTISDLLMIISTISLVGLIVLALMSERGIL